MRDTLDLKVLVQRGMSYRRAAKRFRRRTFALALVAVIILLFLSQFTGTSGTIYRGDGTVWEPMQLPGYPQEIQVAENGDVWVSTYDKAGLRRFDGTNWHHLELSDVVGYGRDAIKFAVWENDVWVVTGKHISQFHDGQWIHYGEVLASDYPVAIAANREIVVVVDYDGTISQFDGEMWHSYDAKSVLPGISLDEEAYASMQTAPNSDIWLSYNGIWRWTNGSWDRVRLNPKPDYYETLLYEVQLVDDRYAWVSNGYELTTINVETGELYEQELIFAENPYDVWYIQSASRSDDTVYFSTFYGILTYNFNVGWSFNPTSLADESIIMSTALDRSGQQWVAVVPLNPYGGSGGLAYLATISSYLIPILGMIVWYFAVYRQQSKLAVTRIERFTKILHQVLPQLEEYKPLSKVEKTTNNLLFQWFIVAVIIVFVIFQYNLSIGTTMALFMLFFPLWYYFYASRNLRDNDISEERKAVVRSNRNRGLVFLVVMFSPIVLIMGNLESLFGEMTPPIFLIGGTISFTLAVILHQVLPLVPYRLILAGAFSRGDYDEALKELERLRPWFASEMTYSSLKAMFNLTAGRYEGIENKVRVYIANYQTLAPQYQIVGLINLAHALGGMERYDEALPILSAAVTAAPETMTGYGHLAAHYLQNEIELERAYELTDAMMIFDQKPWLTWLTFGLGYADLLAIRAVALAHAERFDEAEAMMQRAFDEMSVKMKPGIAVLHSNAAEIKRLQGDEAATIEHLEKAIVLDPQGIIGKKAQEALDELKADQS